MPDREPFATNVQTPEPVPALGTPTPADSLTLTNAPSPGDVPVCTGPNTAEWQPGAVGGPATELATTGAPVDVAAAAPPAGGQVLTASGPGAASWVTPVDPPAGALDVGATVTLGGGAPSAGDVLTAIDASTASFQPPAAAPVSSVFGRAGAVVAAAGDYDSSEVDNASGVAGATVSDALDALDAAIVPAPVSSVFGRAGAVVAVAGDYAASEVDNDSSVGGATLQAALNTLLAAMPSNVRVARPILPPSGAGMLTIAQRAYAIYVGTWSVAKAWRFVEMALTANGGVAQVAEIGIGSTPLPPNKSGQTVTVLTADGALDTLLAGAGTVKRNTTGLGPGGLGFSVPAGTPTWLLFRANFAGAQPSLAAAASDMNQCQALQADGVGPLTGVASFAGVSTASVLGPAAPFLCATLD